MSPSPSCHAEPQAKKLKEKPDPYLLLLLQEARFEMETQKGGLELSAPDLRKGWVANYKQETTRARVSGSVLSTPTA